MINVKELGIPEVKLLMPVVHRDDRGYVTEIVHERQLEELGLAVKLVQENQSLSTRKNTVRGLHCQRPPYAQAKFVRVLRGRALDVAVDVRPNSPTFGKHIAVELSEDEVAQLFIPAGFAHGFCTLTDNTVILYKMSQFYAPGSEVGFLWNDPDIGIKWPVGPTEAILSGKDEKLPRLKDVPPIAW
jgi:dTDP-4-dehydrorhamnose 3,5-epimerase